MTTDYMTEAPIPTDVFVADCGMTFDNAFDKYIHAEECADCFSAGYGE